MVFCIPVVRYSAHGAILGIVWFIPATARYLMTHSAEALPYDCLPFFSGSYRKFPEKGAVGYAVSSRFLSALSRRSVSILVGRRLRLPEGLSCESLSCESTHYDNYRWLPQYWTLVLLLAPQPVYSPFMFAHFVTTENFTTYNLCYLT